MDEGPNGVNPGANRRDGKEATIGAGTVDWTIAGKGNGATHLDLLAFRAGAGDVRGLLALLAGATEGDGSTDSPTHSIQQG